MLTAIFLSILGVVFVFTFVKFIVRVNEMQRRYVARLDAANARMGGKVQPTYGLSFADEEILHTLTARYIGVIDSLGLADQVRGYVLYYDLRPPDFLEVSSSRVDFFLDCGCKRVGMYDLLTLEVDPATLLASASRVRKRITQDQYQPFTTAERR